MAEEVAVDRTENNSFGEKIYRHFEARDNGSSKMMKVLDFMTYAVGLLGAALALSRAFIIWFGGEVMGSMYSWIALAAFTPFWILYGLLNKKFSLVMTYVVWLIAAVLVIIGIYMNG